MIILRRAVRSRYLVLSLVSVTLLTAAGCGLSAMNVPTEGGVPTEGSVLTEGGELTREEVIADIQYDIERPRVYHTSEEVARARKNVRTTDWGKEILEEVRSEAERIPASFETPFYRMPDDQIRSLAPIEAPDGNVYFADDSGGTLSLGSRCPIDRSLFHLKGADSPGKVICEQGHTFPGQTHDGITPEDDGDGWIMEEIPPGWAAAEVPKMEGTRFWFVAKYNGMISDAMADALEPLAHAYALTGDTTFAHKASVLLDVLSTAFVKSYGKIVDYPPGSSGRLHRQGYQVGRGLRRYVHAADLIWPSGVLDGPSASSPGMTVKQNIAENMMVEGALFIWDYMHGGDEMSKSGDYSRIFHNGTVDYNEGMLVVSSLLGLNVGYARWSFEGPVSLPLFLTNTTYRDGQYYETSAPYYGGESFLGWAEMGYHLRNKAYPNGFDVYGDPRFIELNVHGPTRFRVAGREPHYGHGGPPDLAVSPEPNRGSFDRVLHFYARTDDEEKKRAYGRILAEIAGGNPNEQLSEHLFAVFNIDQEISGFEEAIIRTGPRPSEVLPGKGFVMYRPEKGFDRGAMLRYGPPLSKSHADGLGLHVYGGGRELSYDLARFPKQHMANSFNRQTVAHNVVVVNQWSQVPPEDDGGSLHYFTDRSGYSVASISNEGAYAHENIDLYRRTVALIDAGADQSYLIDLFRISGADTTDYSFHGQGVEFSTSLDLSRPRPGSVASPDYCWGNQIRETGHIIPFEDKPREFNAPPGNGYGLLCGPQSASGDAVWSATWSTHPEQGAPARLRLHMLPSPGRTITVADAPDHAVRNLRLDAGRHTLKYLLARDTRPHAQYVAVIEPAGDDLPLRRVQPLEITAKSGGAFPDVAFRVIHASGGTTDYFFSTRSGNAFTAEIGNGTFTTDAQFAMIRVTPEGIATARMERGTHLHGQIQGDRVQLERSTGAYTGTITEIDEAYPSLLVAGDIPSDKSLTGRFVIVDAPEYSHNSPFRIERLEDEGDQTRIYLEKNTPLVLSEATVSSVRNDTLESPADFPLVWTRTRFVDRHGMNEYFDGRQVVHGETGAVTLAEGVGLSRRHVAVQDASGFEAGDSFQIFEIKVGDGVTIPTTAEYRSGDGDVESN